MRPHREDRRVDGEADVCEDLERPEVLRVDREILRAKRGDGGPGGVLDRTPRTLELVAELAAVHRMERAVAVPVRLDLMAFRDELLQQLRKCFGDTALYEERPLHPELVQDGEDPIDVADDAFRDRRVVVDARLVPILDVDRERGDGNVARQRDHRRCGLDQVASNGSRDRLNTRERLYVIRPTTGRRVTRRRWSTSSSSAFFRTFGATSAIAEAVWPLDIPSARPKGRMRIRPLAERGRDTPSPSAVVVVARPRAPASASTAVSSGCRAETSTSAANSSSCAARVSRSISGPAATRPMLRIFSASAARQSRRATRVMAACRGSGPSPASDPSKGVSKTRASASLPTYVGRSVSINPAEPMPTMRPSNAPRTSSWVSRPGLACAGIVAALITAGFGRSAAEEMIASRSDSTTPRCWVRKSRTRAASGLDTACWSAAAIF